MKKTTKKNKTLKRQKTRTIMTVGDAVKRDVFLKISLVIFKIIMATTAIT